MATFIVTTLADDNDAESLGGPYTNGLSLREAVVLANGNAGADTITFDASLSGGTIYLTQGSQLYIDSEVVIEGDIDGDGFGDMAVNANSAAAMDDAASRVFGIYGGATATIDGLTISGGQADRGGAIRVFGSTLNLSGSTVSDSTASLYGGGIYAQNNATVTIEATTISGNSATYGGGLSLESGTLSVTNSSIANNIASSYGGGIYNHGNLTIKNSTITGNNSFDGGAGIDSLHGQLQIQNSIVLGNYGQNLYVGSVTNVNTIVSGDSSKVFANTGPSGGGLLADNGGPVQTIALKADASNPALDASDGTAPSTDARGLAVQDFASITNTNGSARDLGAFELQIAGAAAQTGSLVVTTLDDVVDAFDGETSLREAIAFANDTTAGDLADGDADNDGNANDTITFDASLAGGTIFFAVGNGQLEISSAVTIEGDIDGNGFGDVTIDANSASGLDDATSRVLLVSSGGDASLDSLTITGGYSPDNGGGIYNDGGTTTLTNSTVSGNHAENGGGIYNDRGTTTLTNSTVSGNNAGRGGGINNNGGTTTLTNSTVSGNSASTAGGIFTFSAATTTLTNSTVSGNSASYGGGLTNSPNSTTTLTNSIVLGNTATTKAETGGGGLVTNTDGLSIIGGHAVLDVFETGVLADNGGPVQTIALKADPSNPALDASGAGATTEDARGLMVQDFASITNTNGDARDLGAFELQIAEAEERSLVVTTLDDVVNAFDGETSLREAIAFANDAAAGDLADGDADNDGNANDTITFDASLSGGTITLEQALGELEISSDVTILGDIDGDHAPDITIDAAGYSRVLHITEGASIIDGLTITGGQATYNSSTGQYGNGGGAYVWAPASLTMSNSIVSGNYAERNGGGIYSKGDLTISDSSFTGNSAMANGGGIYIRGHNYVSPDVYDETSASLNNVTVTNNYAKFNGGGIEVVRSDLTMVDSTVSGNEAIGAGGGLRLFWSTTTLTNSTVDGNTSGGYGGGISGYNGTTSLNNVTISGNESATGGGGLYSYYGSTTLTNSTVSGNSAVTGGGISSYSGDVTLTNSIVLGNSATLDPEISGAYTNTGGLSIVGGVDPATIFAAIDGTTGGGLLANNGGPVMTIALLSDPANPALDTSGSGATTGDARGFATFDFASIANTNGNARDLGAFELQVSEAETRSLVVTTLDDVVNAFDGLTSLREAIAFANDATAGSLADGDADNDGNADDTITFDASLSGGTIDLTQGQLVATAGLTINGDIDGDGMADITVDAQGNSRILDTSADTTLRGLTLTGGHTSGAGEDGGGVRATGYASLTIEDTTITGNSTGGFEAEGGGISSYKGDVTLTRTTISGNYTAQQGASGGGLFNVVGAVTLIDSTVSGNSTAGTSASGGGISSVSGGVMLTNSTVSGNSTAGNSSAGGGIFTIFDDVTLVNSTITGNITTGTNAEGGGVSLLIGSLRLNNSIVLGNAAEAGVDGDEIDGAIVETGPNIIGGIDAHTAAEVFADIDGITGGGLLADNGGPVMTVALKADPSNPALDASGTGATTQDARGLSELDFVSITNTNGNARDLGAFELQLAEAAAVIGSLVVTTLDDVVDPFDGLTSLREAIAFANDTAAGDLADGDADNDGNANDTITFDPLLSGGTILLEQALGQLVATDALTINGDIDGDHAPDITIDAQGNSRVLTTSASTTLQGLVITGGHTSGVSEVGGGVSATVYASLTVEDSTITGNSTSGASADGGGIYARNDITISNSTITGNSTSGFSSDGGGIYARNDITISNSTITANSIAGINTRGGGVISWNGSVSLTNTTVSGNSTTEYRSKGGGIYAYTGVTATNSTITGNSTAGDEATGGGIFNAVGNVVLTNSLVLGNVTSYAGLGEDEIHGTVTNNHSIVGSDASLIFAQTAEVLDGNNAATGVFAGVLADNGGPVQTVALKSDNANPALDAGDDGLAPVADARGIARFDQQGVVNNGANISDLGAFELGAQVNLNPAAGNDSLEGTEDEALIIPFADLLYNDFNSDGPQPLTIVSVDNAVNGTAVISGDNVIFTPAAGFTGTASFTYVVSDGGGGYGGAVVQIEVAPAPVIEPPVEGNQPPEVLPDDVTLYTLEGKAIGLHVSASDPDDDPLSFSAGSAAHGMVTGGSGGSFVYTPDAGFLGTDGFVVTVSDGNGGTDTQAVTVEVLDLSGDPDWVLLTTSGFAGEIGGTGAVFGTAGHQDVTILDLAGLVVLDGSFNGGGDIVRLHGNASDWQVAVEGSMAVFNDGDTLVGIPAGPSGLAILFDDGARELVIDGTMQIGGQSVTEAFAVIGAAPDGTSLPAGGIAPDASAALILMPGAEVAAGGELFVFGTPGAETVTATQGALHFDGSFNGGGDTIAVGEAPGDFTVRLDGSTAVFEGSDTSLAVPVGPAGATLSFGGTDAALLYDADLGAAFIGSQEITMTPAPLTFA